MNSDLSISCVFPCQLNIIDIHVVQYTLWVNYCNYGQQANHKMPEIII